MTDRTTTEKDWENYYQSRDNLKKYIQINIDDFRNLPHKKITQKFKEYYKHGSIIELGAGDSDMLIDLCKRFNIIECYGLDYVESACDRLNEKSLNAGVKIKTVNEDMFQPQQELIEKFDFSMSYGVVEHFKDLSGVIKAIKNFVKPNGIVFTLIPNNKNTIYGYLMRKWNVDVYNNHVMYDEKDLKVAHELNDLEILWSGHIASSNFGMLSWCFVNRKKGISYWIYKQLTRVSKAIWYVENKFNLDLSSTWFSPYIICVAKRKP